MPEHQLQEVRELENEAFRQLSIKKRPTSPVIICGDFNNGPESVVYKYMTNSFLRYDFKNPINITGR